MHGNSGVLAGVRNYHIKCVGYLQATSSGRGGSAHRRNACCLPCVTPRRGAQCAPARGRAHFGGRRVREAAPYGVVSFGTMSVFRTGGRPHGAAPTNENGDAPVGANCVRPHMHVQHFRRGGYHPPVGRDDPGAPTSFITTGRAGGLHKPLGTYYQQSL